MATELGDCPGPTARLRHGQPNTTMKRQQSAGSWLQRLELRVRSPESRRWRLMPDSAADGLAGAGSPRAGARRSRSSLALVIVFEEWGWRPLADLRRLARGRPWAAVEALIIRLPPTRRWSCRLATLLLPLKLRGAAAHRQGSGDPAGFAAWPAKVVATARHRPALHADAAGAHADRLV